MPRRKQFPTHTVAATAAAPATQLPPGLRRVEQIMGTAISLDVREASVSPAALDLAFEYLREVDRRFSTYKPES